MQYKGMLTVNAKCYEKVTHHIARHIQVIGKGEAVADIERGGE